MFFIVVGILQVGSNGLLMTIFFALSAAVLIWFFLHIRAKERAGKEPLLSTGLFHNRTSNLALVTQNVQWLLLMGITFVVSVFLQTVRGFSAIETGLVFTAATIGILVSSLAAERLAKRFTQKTLILAGFVVTLAGIALLLGLVYVSSSILVFLPGLLVIGLGLGVMLTPSVNVVQLELPRGAAGRHLGTLAQHLQSGILTGHGDRRHDPGLRPRFGEPLVCAGRWQSLAVIGLIGLAAAVFLPANPVRPDHAVPAPGPLASGQA